VAPPSRLPGTTNPWCASTNWTIQDLLRLTGRDTRAHVAPVSWDTKSIDAPPTVRNPVEPKNVGGDTPQPSEHADGTGRCCWVQVDPPSWVVKNPREPALQYSMIQPSLGVANTMPFLSQSVVSPPRLTPEPTRLGVRATRYHLLPPSVLR
jgi:hypothetical protein